MNQNDQIARIQDPERLAPRTFQGAVLVQEPSTAGAPRGEIYEGQAALALDLQRLTLTWTTPVGQLQRRWPFTRVVDLIQEDKSVRFNVVPPPKREAIARQKEAISSTTQAQKEAFASRLKLYEAGRPYHEEDPGTRSGSQ